MLLHRITDIKNGQCILARDTEIIININEEEKEQENLVQPLVDNITGTTPSIGIITTASSALGVWDYYIPFNTGLIIITTGNGLDATIVYE